MKALEIVTALKAEGITLVLDNDNIKVRAIKSKITDEHRAMILAHKADLLTFLGSNPCPDDYNCGSSAPSTAECTVFKEYKLPNGETLKLTKEEFDRVVDIFRLLYKQSQRVGQSNDVA